MHFAGQERDQRRAATFVRDLHQVDLGHVLEQLGRHVQIAADPGRAIKHVFGALTGQCQQFLDAPRRHRRMHAEDQRLLRQHRERLQIVDRIEREILVQARGKGVARGGDHERVAIRHRPRSQREADGAAASRSIVHDHADAEGAVQPFLQGAHQEIRSTAGCEWNDDADRPLGITVRTRGERRSTEYNQGG